jgi:hypothetical protein
MASTPAFAATPKIGAVAISTADASRTAPSAAGTVLTGVASGTRISRITIQATAATTAGMVRLFLHDGTNFRLFREVPVTAITPTASVAPFNAVLSEQTNIDTLPITLPSGSWSLRASTNNAEAFNVIAEGADL